MNNNYLNWHSGYNGYGGYNTPNYGQPISNVIRVTSLDEAIMRTTQPGSDMMYVHQDKNILYRVKVDLDGKKSWGEFPIIVPDQSDSAPATKLDIANLTARIEAMESKLNSTEVSENAK